MSAIAIACYMLTLHNHIGKAQPGNAYSILGVRQRDRYQSGESSQEQPINPEDDR